jgi:small redox-active disulfide protein 2
MGLFNKIFKTEENKSQCNCGEGCCSQENIDENSDLTIKVLGSGCKNCVTLAENINIALKEMKLTANVVKITDIADIAAYGVMSTPAIVVNEKVVSFGKVLKPDEVVKLLEKVTN